MEDRINLFIWVTYSSEKKYKISLSKMGYTMIFIILNWRTIDNSLQSFIYVNYN